MMIGRRREIRPPYTGRVVLAGAVAATCSGLPSTLHALATGGDLFQATRAAGTLVPGHHSGVRSGVAAHLAVSAGWTVVLAAADRRRRLGPFGGVAAGLLIAALDLEIVGRANPAIRALPRLPQWLDHAAFGAIVGILLPQEEGPIRAVPGRGRWSRGGSRRLDGVGCVRRTGR
jgi:hypothetical protein